MGSLCHNVFKDDLPLMGLFMGLFVVLFIVFFIVLFMGLFSVLFSVFFRGLFKVPPLRGCLRLAGRWRCRASFSAECGALSCLDGCLPCNPLT